MLDRSKLLLGLYSVPAKLYTDEAIAQLKGLDPDYIMLVFPEQSIVSLCEKYNINIFISGRGNLVWNSGMAENPAYMTSDICPAIWSGGDGDNAGEFHKAMTPAMMADLPKYLDSPIICGDFLVDEPSSLDFKDINAVYAEYKRLYPDKMPMLNLYPNYASVSQTTGEQRVNQLGNPSYREHIAQYIREVKLDYLSMDYYPFKGGCLNGYIDNLLVCANACRDDHRDLWYIFQAGAWLPEEQISLAQLRWQCYMGLAFGARSLHAACYYHFWWHPACGCVDSEGNKNPMYDWVKDTFAEMRRINDAYMPYRYTQACLAGDASLAIPLLQKDLSSLPACEVTADAPVVVGKLEKADGGKALVLVNSQDPWDESACAHVSIPVSHATLWRNGYAEEVSGDGSITLRLSGCEGVLVELN